MRSGLKFHFLSHLKLLPIFFSEYFSIFEYVHENFLFQFFYNYSLFRRVKKISEFFCPIVFSNTKISEDFHFKVLHRVKSTGSAESLGSGILTFEPLLIGTIFWAKIAIYEIFSLSHLVRPTF